MAALTLTLAAELARLHIAVNAVAPRARTPMSEKAFGDMSDLGEALAPQFVADVVAWLASATADDVTGQIFVVARRGPAAADLVDSRHITAARPLDNRGARTLPEQTISRRSDAADSAADP